eukprot:279676-Chlamydomonas_euryale.AAC.1
MPVKPLLPAHLSPPLHAFRRLLLAIEQVAEDCGLDDIVPKVWVEEVNGVIPGVGYHIRWLALWMEQAEGISLENLVGGPLQSFVCISQPTQPTQPIQATFTGLWSKQLLNMAMA